MPRQLSRCVINGCPSVAKHVKRPKGSRQKEESLSRCLQANSELPLSFHSIKSEWLEKMGRLDLLEDVKKLRLAQICGRHFKDRAYTSTLRQRLCRAAEPELFLPNPKGGTVGESRVVHIPSSVPEKWQPTRFALRSGLNQQPEQPDVQNVSDGDFSKDDLAQFTVSTLYSTSENGDSSDDCEFYDIEAEEAKLTLPTPLVPTPSQPSPTPPAETTDDQTCEQEPSEGCNHGAYIKKLEKCLVDRSIEIQRLKAQVFSLKRKNQEMQKAAEKHVKLCKLSLN